ncbi:WD40-repeat-containing domain protein [Lophiotrema nucula]|uniref:WD40-repeat-containing domain protein n=1 Tax=Lophiotrema nucula TaxID=690887 RepID=A0A6A5ZF98_9PLEO|nr:WD40-repeat-containing domain protein [Lophiotrema nucula]
MRPNTVILSTLAFLPVAITALAPSRAWVPPIRAVAAPAIPTPTLTSDFKKGNVSAQWAPGHPLQWGTEEKKYVFPDSFYFAALSGDERYVAIVNNTNIQVLSFPDFTLISTPTYPFRGDQVSAEIFRVAPNGQYDLLVAATKYSNDIATRDRVFQIRLSGNGTQIGDAIERAGQLTTFETTYSGFTTPFSPINRRFLVKDGANVTAYDLDDVTYNLTLSGHTDSLMSAVFSPDGKYVATAAWDGYGKLWDATTGKLIHDFGPFTGQQNWLARFSPDGTQVIISVGGRAHVMIWKVEDLTAEPAVLGPYQDWVRTIEYSPDGKYLATGEYGYIRIYKTSDWSVVQTWEAEDRDQWEIYQLAWLDGGKRLTYRALHGVEVYDFETNLKYRWGPGDFDHSNSGTDSTWLVKSKGWIGGVKGDLSIGLWKYPS